MHTTLIQLQSSPYYYEGHVQLIQVLRQLGDLDRARNARVNMSKVYPLSEGDLKKNFFRNLCGVIR